MHKVKMWFQDLGLMLSPVWRQNKVYFLTYILWDCIQSPLSTMLYVYLMQVSINQLSTGAGMWVVATTILLFLAGELALHIGGNALYSLYFEPCQAKMKAQINMEICDHIRHTDYKYFDNPSYYDEYTVSYAQYADKAMEAYGNLSSAVSLLVTVGSLVGYIVSSTVYVLVITFLSVVVKVWVNKTVNKIQIQREEECAPIGRRTDYYRDTLCSREAAMDMKSTKIYDLFVDHYRASTQQDISTKMKYSKKLCFWSSIQALSTDGSSAVIRIIICSLILVGKVGVGSFVSLLSAANSLAWKVQNVSRYYTSLDRSVLYGQKIRHFINQTSEIEQVTEADKEKQRLPGGRAFSISFKDVCFQYENSNFNMKNISFDIGKGEKIAIVGENGGGKTTLTKLLLRLYDPTSGEILIGGLPLKDVELASYRANVGIAFQDSPMYSLSMRDNLSAYAALDAADSLGSFSQPAIEAILAKCGATLDTDVTKKFSKDGIMLSGGEKQKVAVSRLFTKAFGLLIFDEPSSALDPFAEEKLNQMIFDKANSTTTILISHRLSNVVKADRIYVMKDGSIVEKGTHSELIAKKGVYFSMFELQAKNYQEG